MPQLDETLAELRAHEGVEHLLVVGTDGLLLRHVGDAAALDPDTVAAMVPGIAAACDALGRSTRHGELATAVMELESGVAIVVPAPPDLLLVVLLRRNVGFAPLLREVRRARRGFAASLLSGY